MRVFVVDDEEDMLGLLVAVLSDRFGAKNVQGFTSPTEAAKAIAQQRPDVVVTDYRMPGLTGLELIEQAGATPVQSRFILMSAYADSSLATHAETADSIVAYIPKPLDPDELCEQVQHAADRPRAA